MHNRPVRKKHIFDVKKVEALTLFLARIPYMYKLRLLMLVGTPLFVEERACPDEVGRPGVSLWSARG